MKSYVLYAVILLLVSSEACFSQSSAARFLNFEDGDPVGIDPLIKLGWSGEPTDVEVKVKNLTSGAILKDWTPLGAPSKKFRLGSVIGFDLPVSQTIQIRVRPTAGDTVWPTAKIDVLVYNDSARFIAESLSESTTYLRTSEDPVKPIKIIPDDPRIGGEGSNAGTDLVKRSSGAFRLSHANLKPGDWIKIKPAFGYRYVDNNLTAPISHSTTTWIPRERFNIPGDSNSGITSFVAALGLRNEHVFYDDSARAAGKTLEELNTPSGTDQSAERTWYVDSNGNISTGHVGFALAGVFSSTNEVLSSSVPHRLPGAIDAGTDYVTPRTARGGLATDIPEDFLCDTSHTVIQIPAGAKYIFFSVLDGYFSDNGQSSQVEVIKIDPSVSLTSPRRLVVRKGTPVDYRIDYATFSDARVTVDVSDLPPGLSASLPFVRNSEETKNISGITTRAGVFAARIRINNRAKVLETNVTFDVRVAPEASAGNDILEVDSNRDGIEAVTLNGSGTDEGGSIASYEWFDGATHIGVGQSISLNLPIGIHEFKLKVTDNDGETAEDTVSVRVKPDLNPPSLVEASNDQFDEVTVTWTSVPEADSYFISRSESNDVNSAYVVGHADHPATAFVDSGALPGVTYYYWVSSFNEQGGSGPSSVAVGMRKTRSNSLIETPTDQGVAPETERINLPESYRATFRGLLKDGSDPAISKGRIVASVFKNLVSLTLTQQGNVYRGRAFFEVDGSASTTFVLKSGESIEVSLQLTESTEGDQRLEGAVVDTAGSFDSNIVAIANPFHRKRNPAPFASAYTILLPDEYPSGNSAKPSGVGAGIGSVNASGVAKFKFYLSDGARTLATGYTSSEGEILLYSQPYGRGKSGQLAGRLFIRDVVNVSDFDGTLHWVRPPGEIKPVNYGDGFNVEVKAIGSKFERPRKSERLLSQLPDGEDNALFSMDRGNITPIPNNRELTWSDRNQVNDSSNTRTQNIAVRPNTKNGTVDVRFRNSDIEPVQAFDMKGVAFQKQGVVAGNFSGNGKAGLFMIEPVELPEISITAVGGILNDGDQIDFGDVGIEGGAGSRVVTISNVGNGNLWLPSDLEIFGDSAFYLSTFSAGYIAPGESLGLRIGFNPNATTHSGQIKIESNDRSNSPFVLNLVGNGLIGNALNNHEAGTNSVSSPFTRASNPEPALERSAVVFDPLEHSGKYVGLIFPSEGNIRPVGFVSAAIRFSPRSAIASISGSLVIDGVRGAWKGKVGEGGGIHGVLSSRLAVAHQIDVMTLVESVDGRPGISGVISDSETGEQFVFMATKAGYDKLSEPASQAGRYTCVLPMNEALGGISPGDGVGALRVSGSGSIRGTYYLGNGAKISFSSVVSDSDLVSIYFRRGRTWLAGDFKFRDIPGVSDFDGSIFWATLANPRSTVPGFETNIPILGSRFTPTPGEAALAGTTESGANVSVTYVSPVDLTTGISDVEVGPLDFNWSAANRLTYLENGPEKAKLNFSAKTGILSGFYRDADGAVLNARGVLFSKQNKVGGHYISKSKSDFGYFYLLQNP